MSATQEYLIQINGDASKLESAINQANGKLQLIEGHKYKISMDVDMDKSAYDKFVKSIENKKLKVQIDYDRTKSSINTQKAFLQDAQKFNKTFQNGFKNSKVNRIINDQIQSIKHDMDSGLYDLGNETDKAAVQDRLKNVLDMTAAARVKSKGKFRLSDNIETELSELTKNLGIEDYSGNIFKLNSAIKKAESTLKQDEAHLNSLLSGKTDKVSNEKFIDKSGKTVIDMTQKATQDRITARATGITEASTKANNKESESFENTKKSASGAAQAKTQFTNANQKVKTSSQDSSKSLKQEKDQLENVQKSVDTKKQISNDNSDYDSQLKAELKKAQITAKANGQNFKVLKQWTDSNDNLYKAQIETTKTENGRSITNVRTVGITSEGVDTSTLQSQKMSAELAKAKQRYQEKYYDQALMSFSNEYGKYSKTNAIDNEYKKALGYDLREYKKNKQAIDDYYSGKSSESDEGIINRIKRQEELGNKIKNNLSMLKQTAQTDTQISKQEQSNNKIIDSVRRNVDSNKYGSEYSKMQSSLGKYSRTSSSDNEDLKTARRAASDYNYTQKQIRDMIQGGGDIDVSKLTSKLEYLEKTANRFQEAMKRVQNSSVKTDIGSTRLDGVKAEFQSVTNEITKLGKTNDQIDASMKNIKIAIDSGDIDQATASLSTLKKQLSNLKQSSSDTLKIDSIVSEVNELKSSLQSAGVSLDQFSSKFKELESAAASGNLNKVKQVADQIEKETLKLSNDYISRSKNIDELQKTIGKHGLQTNSASLNKINSLRQMLDQSKFVDYSKFDQKFASTQAQIRNSISSSIANELSKNDNWLNSRVLSERYTGKAKTSLSVLSQARKDLDEFRDEKTGTINLDTSEAVAALDRYRKALADAKKQCSDASNILSNPISNNKLAAQVSSFINQNHKLSSDYVNDLKEIQQNLNKTGLTAKQQQENLIRFNKIKQSANDAGMIGGNTIRDQISSTLKNKTADLVANFFSYQDIIRYAQQIASTVTEINSAQTELQKVSDASNKRIQQNFQTSAKTAQELGATISDVITDTADWSRLGYSIDQAENLARTTQLFQNVGDNMSRETAQDTLVSAMKAYNFNPQDSLKIIDKYNETANNFAINTEQLADGISRSGSALKAAGNSLDQSIAMMIAGNDSVQNSETVGRQYADIKSSYIG